MTLPASGNITWNQICAEFSLTPSTAIWPASFYGKGGVQSSGPLAFGDFYGRSATASPGTYNPAPGSYTYQDNNGRTGGAQASVTANSGSVPWTYSIAGSNVTPSITSGSSAATISFTLASAASGSGQRTATVTLNQGANSWTLTLIASAQGNLP